MDKVVLEQIFEGLDKNLVSAELRQKVSEMIEGVVKTRVEALTQELAAKEALFIEEAGKVKAEFEAKEAALLEQIAQKEKVLEEEAVAFAEKVATGINEKEAIMVEEVENYRKQVEGLVAEEASAYRDHLEAIVKEESENYKNYVESIALEEARNHKTQQDAVLAKEVGEFKKEMVDKISEFFEAELVKNIPQEVMESAVKLSAYEPLVESIMGVFSKNYIKLDTTSYEVIKEARKTNEDLTQSLNAKVKDNVRLAARVKDFEKKSKISDITEGLTIEQRKKAVQLLENYNLEEIDAKFAQVKDIIIESSVKGNVVVEAKTGSPAKSEKQPLSENAKKQIEKLKSEPLTESVMPEMAEWQKRLRKQH
jgi:hypothetical protein